MSSISPNTVKQAISAAYDPKNPQGKRELWNVVLAVLRRGLSHEEGNPWRDILAHWNATHQAFQREHRSHAHHWQHARSCGGGCRQRGRAM